MQEIQGCPHATVCTVFETGILRITCNYKYGYRFNKNILVFVSYACCSEFPDFPLGVSVCFSLSERGRAKGDRLHPAAYERYIGEVLVLAD